MCRFCDEYLGSRIVNHKESECPLKAAAHCGLCVAYGHFETDCPYRAKLKETPISSIIPDVYPHIVYIPDREAVHRAYLSSHGNVIYGKAAKNKTICEGIAKSHGYEKVVWIKKKV
jgi:hypothetical protein